VSTATAVKERPILFSSEMVRAILEGRKTQTRRVVTPQTSVRQAVPNAYPFDLSRAYMDDGFYKLAGEARCQYLHVPFCHPDDGWCVDPVHDTIERWYPRWEPGDRLWVRETWRMSGNPQRQWVAYKASNDRREVTEDDERMWRDGIERYGTQWRPSIHMPHWASRITLEVTDVRVERLCEISREDVLAEGVGIQHLRKFEEFPEIHRDDIPGMAFAEVWNPLNAKRGFPWDRNPWVWVVAFKQSDK